MNQPFFTQPARIASLLIAVESWMGTPFRERAALKGVGVDCVHLAHALMVKSGLALPSFDLGDYPLDWAQHRDESLLVAWIERIGCCALLDAGTPLQAGDAVCFRQGRCSHHIGIMLDDRWFVHVPQGREVQRGMIDDPTFANVLARVYRPLEVGAES